MIERVWQYLTKVTKKSILTTYAETRLEKPQDQQYYMSTRPGQMLGGMLSSVV